MGCYDSAILRPLLGSSQTDSSSNNNGGESVSNNNNGGGHNRGGFSFRRRPGYEGMVDEEDGGGDESYGVKYGRKNCTKSSFSVSSIMLVARKVGLLVWKNLLLRKRHYVVTSLEIVLPTLFALILVYGRSKASGGGGHPGAGGPGGEGGLPDKIPAIQISRPTYFPELSENDFKFNCNHFGFSEDCIVAYAPKNPWTDGIIDLVKSFDIKSRIEWTGFGSETEIEGKLAGSKLNNSESDFPLKAAIIFNGDVNSTSYKIRILDSNNFFPREFMKAIVPWLQLPGPSFDNKYKDSGFANLQLSLDKAIIMKLTGAPYPKTISLQAFPYPPYEFNTTFSEMYFLMLPMVLVLGFIFIVPSVMRGVVNERETGIKELMKMSGMSNWMHWFAWMINSMLFLTISVTIVTFLLCSGYLNQNAGPIVAHGNPFIWWIILLLYILSSTAFLFFISSFFQRPALAITVGIIFWLATFFPPLLTFGDNNKYLTLTLLDKMTIALLPNMALTWALKVMCAFEGRSIGVQFNNVFQSLSSVDELTLGHVIFMFLLDTFFYLLLTLYVEAVLPSKYGIRKPWYFIIQPSYWKSNRPTKSLVVDEHFEDAKGGDRGFEVYPDGLKVGVEIRNMKKKFGSKKLAVNGVSVKMFDGEIFALLGHNGAGKTTTMSCCIGMISPTSGTAIINGHDIRTNLDEVRQHLGLCPQHNLFFDELTVMEHLMFFARMKGLSKSESASDSHEMLRKLQMTEKTNTLARDLSGGQKRKLCLGISLVGRAKVVFLDEPTSGMDVEARRAIWDLLLKERGHRTIILTTHFMEEADVLGDRIGIMANGRLQCVGTSLFLKKFYGTGYTLSLTTADSNKCTDILRTVNQRIPHAEFKQKPVDGQSPCEWSIVIPSESFSTSVFPAMFKDLQESKDTLGIHNIGLSLTTMDEVFVKAGEASEENHDSFAGDEGHNSTEIANFATISPPTYSNGSSSDDSVEDGVITERVQGIQLLRQQFIGLILKRYSYTIRKWGLCFTQFVIPILMLVLAITSGNSRLKPSPQPPALPINLTPYKNPITLYYASDTAMGDAYASIVGSSAKVFAPANSSDSLVEGLLRIGEADLAIFRERHIIAADINSTHFKALYSTIPFHAMPLTINVMSNAILRMENKAQVINVGNHPMEEGFENVLQALQPDPAFSMSNALMFGVLVPVGLALLAASYVVAPIEEKLCNGKQLQFMTGVNPITYWGSSFVWDYFVMINVIIVMILCFVIFQTDHAYTSYGGGGVIFLILLTYGYSAIPFSYVCSLIAGTIPGGFSLVVILHMASGIVVSFAVYLLEALAGLDYITSQVRFFARVFPTFGASVNTMRFVEIALKNSRCNFLPENFEEMLCDPKVELDLNYRQCCSNCKTDFVGAKCFQSVEYISWSYKRTSIDGTISSTDVPGIGQELLYMFLLGIFYQVLLIVLEYGWIKRLLGLVFRTGDLAFQTNTQDEDVLQEAQRVSGLVKSGKVDEDALVVENFSKSYGSFAAVSNLSFGVHHGECFGLLGVNGAGKTTTFKMLTGDELRSNGNAYSMMLTLESHKKQFLANIGYCPQFDGLIGFLTGREMVALFGRLRGVKSIPRESQKWLQKVGLVESADVQCRKYSGGMKRRLSAAMAMIGDPEIVLLDEPTSGVDPISRREFWKIISAIKASGRAIILTSHSMDEITACCSRLGIMVNGQMQCLGTVQHLKSKYAQGYTLAIKLIAQRDTSVDDAAISRLENRITASFSPCSQKDKHQTSLQYHIQNASIPWDILFQTMEDLKSEFPDIIEEYSITETSLEEVFLAFARTQYPPRLADVPVWRRCITCQFC